MFIPSQRQAAPWSAHNWWGQYNNAAGLPNVAGSSFQLGNGELQRGDVAWAEAESMLYFCIDPTPNAALWTAIMGVAPTSAGAVLTWGDDNVSASTATRYLAPGWDDGSALTTPRQFAAPRAGIARNLRIVHQTPRGNGNPIVYTLRVNGVVTALSATLLSTDATGADTTNSVPIAAGDILDIEVTKAAGVGQSPLRIGASLELA